MTETTTVVDQILGVMSDIGSWFGNTVSTVSEMFYANGSLTFIGLLAVIGVSIATILLIINLVKSFLQLR